jgi:two-component system phosphate regulon sensor histidine kinase PhoR
MIRKLWIRFLLLYLAVVFLAVCVASLYSHVRLRSYFVSLLEEDLHHTARTLSVLLDPRADEAALDALCRELKERSGYRVTLIDPTGRVLGDSDRDASSMENHLYRPEVRDALGKGFGTSIRFSHTMSCPMLYGAFRAGSGSSSYFLRLSVPLQGVSAELSKIRMMILQGSLLAFLAAIPVLVLLSRRMSRRVERITAFVHAARQGDLSRRLHVGSRDELGVLEGELDEVVEEMSGRIEELTSERKRLKTLLESIQEGILLVDAQDSILFMNPYALEIMGIGDEAVVVGRRLLEVMRSDELHGLVRTAREQAHPPEPREVLLPWDPERPFLARARTVRDAARGEPGACLVLLRDISERKRLEKVRADFLSRVSHELRTPLTLIKGFVETLKEEGFQNTQEAQRYLSVIDENTDRLVRLVGDLVRLSSIELGRLPLRVQGVPLKELVHRAAQSFEVRAKEKGLELTVEIPEGLPLVMADPDRLTEILFNLLDNAIKFTPQGRIRVSAASRPADAEPQEEPGPTGLRKGAEGESKFLYVPPATRSQAGVVALEVEDTGFGIPAGELPRVTERFFQGERRGQEKEKGSGLGLAIVKHLVKVMGGRLSIRSREARGTAVEVTLPAAPEEDDRPEQDGPADEVNHALA